MCNAHEGYVPLSDIRKSDRIVVAPGREVERELSGRGDSLDTRSC